MKVRRINNYKCPSKLRNEEHRNYFTNIIDGMIMNEMVINNCKSARGSFITKTRETQKLFH